ncbi:hypothetical protein BO85DRAFT_103815 [Aspergillus piperis CBS 112811]|uniref:Uncharacterized protein n=1 Tax=Aspergillus piperis CBS 112811 TaxID=1448313 RepID=A0A8G1QYF2_9EURO|nr:hypothetical protein BO85DRAFT_103815 [Aspergillus piperis CBS 112811]RAH54450.1 hypothetical protein BO85DRAFT_103815 [Aspergillus piperis CBS 112811]
MRATIYIWMLGLSLLAVDAQHDRTIGIESQVQLLLGQLALSKNRCPILSPRRRRCLATPLTVCSTRLPRPHRYRWTENRLACYACSSPCSRAVCCHGEFPQCCSDGVYCYCCQD